MKVARLGFVALIAVTAAMGAERRTQNDLAAERARERLDVKLDSLCQG